MSKITERDIHDLASKLNVKVRLMAKAWQCNDGQGWQTIGVINARAYKALLDLQSKQLDDTTLLYRDAGGAKRRLMDEAKRLYDQLNNLYTIVCHTQHALTLSQYHARVNRLADMAKQRYERRQRAYFTTEQQED